VAVKPIGIRTLMAAVAVAAVFLYSIASYQQRDNLARQAADRTQCLANLRQIGQAIATYQVWNRRYPSGTIPNDKIRLDLRAGWGALVYQIGEEGCSGCPAIDPSRPWDDPQVVQDSSFRSRKMRCPSGPKLSPATFVVPACYVGIAGLGPDAPGLPVGDRRAGIFGDDRRVTAADIKDGLANTMMVADTAHSRGPWFAGGRATVRGVDPTQRPQVGQGRPFGGTHGEGANVLMADGSVRWVRPTPSSAGFEAMSTIAGGEVAIDPYDSP